MHYFLLTTIRIIAVLKMNLVIFNAASRDRAGTLCTNTFRFCFRLPILWNTKPCSYRSRRITAATLSIGTVHVITTGDSPASWAWYLTLKRRSGAGQRLTTLPPVRCGRIGRCTRRVSGSSANATISTSHSSAHTACARPLNAQRPIRRARAAKSSAANRRWHWARLWDRPWL